MTAPKRVARARWAKTASAPPKIDHGKLREASNDGMWDRYA
jgi:hypothetical protein